MKAVGVERPRPRATHADQATAAEASERVSWAGTWKGGGERDNGRCMRALRIWQTARGRGSGAGANAST